MANVGLEGDAGQSEAEDWGEDSEEEGEDAADEMMVQDEGSGQEHKEEDEEDEEDEVHVKRTKKSRKAPKKGNFACGHCSRVFQHKQSLTRHIAGHAKPNGIHDCPLCDKRFNLKQAKDRHMRTHGLEDRLFTCRTCRKRFKNEATLARHLETHQKSKVVGKGDANRKQRTSADMESDGDDLPLSILFRTTSGSRDDDDTESDGGGDDDSNAGDSGETDDGGNAFGPPKDESDCGYCGVRYLTSFPGMHVSAKEMPESGGVGTLFPDSCSYCSQQFASFSSMVTHERLSHPNEQPYSCSVCDWRFAISCDLAAHETAHFKTTHSKREETAAKALKLTLGHIAPPAVAPPIPSTQGRGGKHKKARPPPKAAANAAAPMSYVGQIAAESKPAPGTKSAASRRKAPKSKLAIPQHVPVKPAPKPKPRAPPKERSRPAAPAISVAIDTTEEGERSDRNNKKMACPVCFKRFAYSSEVTRHVRSHERKNLFRCHFCPYEFDSLDACQGHMDVAHAGQCRL